MNALRRLHAPHLGCPVVLGGWKPPTAEHRAKRLKLANYFQPAKLEAIPPQTDWTPAAQASLSRIFLNDQLGDCVIAAGYHLVGVATGNAGAIYVPADADVQADYSAITGYVPGRPETDQGTNIDDAVKYWQTVGFKNGTKLLGAVAIDPSNVHLVQTAIYLEMPLLLGAALPDAWIGPFPSANGFTWDKGAPGNPQNGHCIAGPAYGPTACGFNGDGIRISTWGLLGRLTYAGLAQYFSEAAGGDCLALVTPDVISKATGKSAGGIAWADLVTDFQRLGGTVANDQVPAAQAS